MVVDGLRSLRLGTSHEADQEQQGQRFHGDTLFFLDSRRQKSLVRKVAPTL